MSKLDELRKESTTTYQKRKELETKLYDYKQKLGALLLSEGSGSSAYREAVKRLHAAEDDLDEIKTLQEALNSAIKQAEKQERQRVSARICEENKKIVEKYSKNLPECPTCKTNEHVKIVEVYPRGYDLPTVTMPIQYIEFECDRLYVGHRFRLLPSDWEPLTEKIGETAKKIGAVIASVF